ncbi:tape measure protein [Microtetraspora fusca]|uniref:Tape measure protein n=1 Tax=Microtetraspora fusca TaxID=1997 RepID=A0ABW6VKD0_MICFU
MANVGYATLQIIPSMRGIQGKLTEELGGQASTAARTAGSKAGGILSGAMSAAVRLAPFLSVGAAIGFALTKGLGRLTAIENAQAKLTGLGHSAKSVQTIMDNALGAVKGTAFGLDEAATVAASAVAAGIKPGQDLRRVLGLVGDTASIAGTSMGEMGAIFNKVAASNRLSLGEVNQLADRGVPILAMLAKQFGVTQGEMAKMVSAGKVDFAAFAKALETNIGGAALKSGDTTQGALKNMQAAAGRFGAALLQGVFPIAKKVFGGITTFLDEATTKVKPFAESISTWIVNKVVPAAENLLGKVGQLGSKLNEFFASATGRQLKTDTMEKLSGILSKLRSAAKDVGPAISGIARSLGQASATVGISTWQLLLATVDALAQVANDVLVPAIKALADWMSKHQGVVTALVGAYAGYRTAMMAATVATKAFGAVKAFGKVAEGLSSIIKSGRLVVGVIRAISAAIMANPIGLIVTGLVALGFLLYEAYQRFEGFREVVDSVFGWIGSFVGKFVDGDWAGAWDMIVQLASDAWDLIKQGAAIAWDWITEKASDAWGAFVGWIKDQPGQIAGKAREIGSAIVDWLKELPGKIADKAIEAGKAIADWLKELPGKVAAKAKEIGSAIAGWLKELPGKIRDEAVEIGGAIAEWVKGLPEKIGPWLESAAKAIIEWGMSLPEKIKEAIGTGEQIIEWLKEWGPKIALGLAAAVGIAILAIPAIIATLVGAVALAVGTALGELAKSLGQKLGEVMSEAGRAVSRGVDKIVDWFRDLPSRAVDAVSSLPGKLKTWATDLAREAASKFGELRDKVVDAFTSLKDKAIEKAGDLVAWVKGLPDKILKGLGNLGNLLVQAGKDAIQGLINGVKSKAAAVADVVGNLIRGNVIGAAQAALETHSPSKVFQRIGKWTVQGFIKGIHDEQGEAKKAVDGLVAMVKDAFKATPKAPDALVEWVHKETVRLQEVAAKREEIIKSIADAKKYADDIAKQMVGFADVTDFGLGEKPRGSQVAALLHARMESIKRFANDIKVLAQRGLNKTTLQQIIDAGPEKGLALADMLVGSTGSEIRAINRAQDQINKVSKQMGKNSADALYDVGKQAGQGFLKGLQGQLHELESMMARIAKAVVDSVKKELKIKSPSRVFEEIGDNTMAGFIKGILGSKSATVDAMSATVDAATLAAASSVDATSRLAAADNQLAGAAGRGVGGVTQIIHATIQVPPTVNKGDVGREINEALAAYKRSGGRLVTT